VLLNGNSLACIILVVGAMNIFSPLYYGYYTYGVTVVFMMLIYPKGDSCFESL
jgi:hypothetical protein